MTERLALTCQRAPLPAQELGGARVRVLLARLTPARVYGDPTLTRLLSGRPLVPAADLVALAMSRLAADHRTAARSGLDINSATWTIQVTSEGLDQYLLTFC